MKKVVKTYKEMIKMGYYNQSLNLLMTLTDKNMLLQDAMKAYRRTIYTCHKKI